MKNQDKAPQDWEKEFDEIFSREAQGILIMGGKERFDMCERILSKDGKIKDFIRHLLQKTRDETHKEGARIQAEIDEENMGKVLEAILTKIKEI